MKSQSRILDNWMLGTIGGGGFSAFGSFVSQFSILIGLLSAVLGVILTAFSMVNAINAWRDRREQKRVARQTLEARIDAERERFLSANGSGQQCTVPPSGWYCTREGGHAGPCAARPIDETAWREHFHDPNLFK